MKKAFLVFAITLAAASICNAQTRQERLTNHVYWFASDSLNGRAAGTPDAAKAADYIVEEFKEIGLTPFFDDWFHWFSVPGYKDRTFHNVVGKIEGSDPILKDEYIVIGAHYDHLGFRRGEIYNGADDNASGTAAVIEIARELMKNPQALKRTVIIAAFDAEELGLFGSNALSDTLDVSKVKLMMSIDMVGWLHIGKTLKMEGAATIRNGKKILSENAKKVNLAITPVNFEYSIMTATDTQGFAEKQVPTLAISTGLKSPYHKPEDDAVLVDYEGLDKITGYLSDVTKDFACDQNFGPSGRLSYKHRDTRIFEVGATAGMGFSYFNFVNSAVKGKPGFAWNGGLVFQLNMGKMLSLKASPCFEQVACKYPDAADVFNSYLKWKQNAITVPVDLIIHKRANKPIYPFAGIGGYYSRMLSNGFRGSDAECPDVRQNQGGMEWCFGTRLYFLELSVCFRYQLNNLFTEPSAPVVRNRETMFNLTYYF